MKRWIAENAKAVVGAFTAGLASLQQALDDNSVNAQEATGVGLAFLTALGVVWGVENRVSTRKAAALMVEARAREDDENRPHQ